MDASDTVFTLARRRVYTKEEGDGRIHSPGLPPGIKPVLETQPKWSLFLSILDELRDQVGKEKDEKGKCTFSCLDKGKGGKVLRGKSV